MLKDASLFRDHTIVTPDLALYEVINVVWKHAAVLKDIKDGKQYLDLFFELVYSNVIRMVLPGEKIAFAAYELARKKKCTFYDAIFCSNGGGAWDQTENIR